MATRTLNLTVVAGLDSDRQRRADEADRAICLELYDVLRRRMPALDVELSGVRTDLLVAASHLGRLGGLPRLGSAV